MKLPYDKLTRALGALNARYGTGGVPREVYVSFYDDAAIFRVAGAGAASVGFGNLPEYPPQVFKTSIKHLSAELGAALGAKPPLSAETVDWNADGSFEIVYEDKSIDPIGDVLKITGRVPLMAVSADDAKAVDRVFNAFLPSNQESGCYGGNKLRETFAVAASVGADWLNIMGSTVYWLGGGGIGRGCLEITGVNKLNESLTVSRDFAAILSRVSDTAEDIFLTNRCAAFDIDGVDVNIEIPQERGIELAGDLIAEYEDAWDSPVSITLYTEVAAKVHGEGVFEITPKGVIYRDDDGEEYKLDNSYWRESVSIRGMSFVVPPSVSKAYKPFIRLAFADINGKRVAVASGGASDAKFLMEVGS